MTTIAGGFADSGGYSLPTAQQQPGYGLVDGLGTAAAFWNPFGITTDGAGNMWVADNYRSVIRFIGDLASPSVSPSVAPSPSPSAAAPATLVASVASTVRTLVAYPQGGLPRVQPSSLISLPQGAVLAAGTLYVTASGFHTLLAINPWSGATTLFAGSPTGAAGYTDSFSTAALFREPSGLAYDGMGTLFGTVDFAQFIAHACCADEDAMDGMLILEDETPSVVTMNPVIEGGCALQVGRLLGLRSADAFASSSPAPADAPPFFGNQFFDPQGGHWQEINLQTLSQSPQFLNISA